MPSTRNPGRYAGLWYLLVSIPAVFALVYVPGQVIVRGNATVTANNIVASEMLYRVGIGVQLISQALFIFVAVALYDLLKGVNKRLALLMVTLIVVSIPISFANELNAVAALFLARGGGFLAAIDKPQRDALAMLFVNVHGLGFDVAGVFWGLWLFPMGRLVYESRFIPRFLGVWLAVGGVAYLIMSLTGLILPEYRGKLFTAFQPAFLSEVGLMLWLIVKGARPPTDTLLVVATSAP